MIAETFKALVFPKFIINLVLNVSNLLEQSVKLGRNILEAAFNLFIETVATLMQAAELSCLGHCLDSVIRIE